MLGTANMTEKEYNLLIEVGNASCSVYEPANRLSRILALQDRGLIVLAENGWTLTNDGRRGLEAWEALK